MGRALRTVHVGGVYHVMNRGVNRQPIFFGDADRVEFGRRLADLYDRFGVETLAYCLMTNHYHLLVRPTGDGLSAAMQHLGGVYTRHTNRRVGRDGPLFRGRFGSLPVTTDPYFAWVVRYIHLNPLDLPAVTSGAQYRWSSLRTYLGLRPSPEFMNLDPVRSMWPDLASFRAFHTDDASARLAVVDIGDLDALIAHEIAVDELQHGTGDEVDGVQATHRVIRALVGDRCRSVALRSVVESSFATANARYSALSRARGRACNDARIDRIVTNVLRAAAA